ncbi:hypothetical protein D3C75_901850 [compost metagenome]
MYAQSNGLQSNINKSWFANGEVKNTACQLMIKPVARFIQCHPATGYESGHEWGRWLYVSASLNEVVEVRLREKYRRILRRSMGRIHSYQIYLSANIVLVDFLYSPVSGFYHKTIDPLVVHFVCR